MHAHRQRTAAWHGASRCCSRRLLVPHISRANSLSSKPFQTSRVPARAACSGMWTRCWATPSPSSTRSSSSPTPPCAPPSRRAYLGALRNLSLTLSQSHAHGFCAGWLLILLHQCSLLGHQPSSCFMCTQSFMLTALRIPGWSRTACIRPHEVQYVRAGRLNIPV